ncbi:hypothetical protein BO71DRAFT_113744 [Aspergillus ellipticus CBS 707.79]|uniref:Uncharacterized protein n=1 Tax=Aspergillus ellipticus CBS 707.79 TaxID=1448320 RepID=A0A319D3U8_9EURO|nr:hypothetical protein BO71DRAFT_113744 [Aspergillus ellipticus CBS 707.79]
MACPPMVSNWHVGFDALTESTANRSLRDDIQPEIRLRLAHIWGRHEGISPTFMGEVWQVRGQTVASTTIHASMGYFLIHASIEQGTPTDSDMRPIRIGKPSTAGGLASLELGRQPREPDTAKQPKDARSCASHSTSTLDCRTLCVLGKNFFLPFPTSIEQPWCCLVGYPGYSRSIARTKNSSWRQLLHSDRDCRQPAGRFTWFFVMTSAHSHRLSFPLCCFRALDS